MIREAGRTPIERDALYNVVSRWDLESLPLELPKRPVALPVLN
ncbi:MAG: hypothetical protein K0Q72_5360, partial [Armatimonadetes bacterium]|nr:hypothetical protein [Armatimonadota bacterium]